MHPPSRPAPDAKICINCRYLSLTPGVDLRCADPAASDFDRKIQPTSYCGRFQISFAAAKLLAFHNAERLYEPWQTAMHVHLTTHAKS